MKMSSRILGTANRNGMNAVRVAGLVSAVALTGILPASAQQIPPGAQPGVIDRPVPRPPADIERERREIERPVLRPEDVPGASQVVATLRQINFKGNRVISTQTLNEIVQGYLNRPVTRGEIAQLKYDVNKEYYDRGYILVRVVTPPQDLSGGVLNVDIFEARIGAIEVNNPGVLAPHVVDGMTSRVAVGDVFEEQAVESMVNDLNDIGNVDAVLNLRRGRELGTTDMMINLVASDEDRQRVSADNYGSDVTGRYVFSANLQKSNFFNFGERFNADVFASEEGTYSVQGVVTIPTGLYNIMFDTRYIRSHIEIGPPLDALHAVDANGWTEIFEAAFSSKLINMRRQVVAVRAGLQGREHRSYVPPNPATEDLQTDDDIRQVFVEGSYLARFPDLLVFGSMRVARGLDIFSASDKGEFFNTRALGDPENTLFQPLLFANYRPLPDGELKVTVTGQYATNTALSSDLFVLGGYNSVRGFEPAQLVGEAGIQASVEYNHTVWQGQWEGANWTAAVGPIVDGGHVWNRLPLTVPGDVRDNTLISAGFGAQAETDITGVGRTRVRLDAAFPIGDYDSSGVGFMFMYFRVSQDF
ncbi:MAG TPA: ShlB/FhaC/HecB family hemolysin secretion/activation protein [Alphaproteobacteria bacterium]